jgi:hypothetical protein
LSPLAGAKVLILFCTCKFSGHYFRSNGYFCAVFAFAERIGPLAERPPSLAETSPFGFKLRASCCIQQVIKQIKLLSNEEDYYHNDGRYAGVSISRGTRRE